MEAYRRRPGQLRCSDVMTSDVVTVREDTPVQAAWALMKRHGIKALPVIDAAGRSAGIVTMADFVRVASDSGHLAEHLRTLLGGDRDPDKVIAVGELMTRNATVAVTGQYVADLMPLFAEAGHHHIPVVDEAGRVVGVITESDFVRALYRRDDA